METVKLKECCTIIAGQSPASRYYNTEGKGIPFFQGKSDFGKLYPSIHVFCTNPIKIAEKDDILLSVRAPVGPTNLSPGRVCIGRGLTAIRPSNNVDLKYLLYYFRYYEGWLRQKGNGTTFGAITQKFIQNIEIRLPTVSEQKRVVSYIEEQLSQLDNSVETLNKVKQQLAVYRQVVLKEAFSADYPRVSLGSISTAFGGYAFKSKMYDTNGAYVVVKIGNVKRNGFDFSRDLTRTNPADNSILDRYLLKRGDCLITLTGSRGKRDYGFVTMVTNQKNFLLNQRVAALRFDSRIALPDFFKIYLSSPQFRNQFFSYETGNVGQGNVGMKALKEPLVPCPPISMQYSIATEVDKKMSVCDSIEQTVDTAIQQSEAMRQSILKQAFET